MPPACRCWAPPTCRPAAAQRRAGSSIEMRTGMRCTILVKLPVALSGGSKANSRPLAGDTLSTWPCAAPARQSVDRDRNRLAGPHVGELGFLVVRDHISGVQRHHRHQLRARRDILPDPQAAGADRAVDRRGDRRIAQVQLGLTRNSAGVLHLRAWPDRARSQHRHLALGGKQGGLVVTQLRRGLVPRRARSAACAAPSRRPSSARAWYRAASTSAKFSFALVRRPPPGPGRSRLLAG